MRPATAFLRRTLGALVPPLLLLPTFSPTDGLALARPAALSIGVQVTNLTATTSPWSLSQSLSPNTLDLSATRAHVVHLRVTVHRAAAMGPVVYHATGTLTLANSTASPVPISRLTVAFLTAPGGSLTPNIPVAFSSPLATGASATLPFSADFRLTAPVTPGTALPGFAVQATALFPTGVAQHSTAPVSLPMPAPQAIAARLATLHSSTTLTDSTSFAAALGMHSSGANATASGGSIDATLALPEGGSRTYLLDISLAAHHGGMGRLIAISQLFAGSTNITDCGAGKSCPTLGVLTTCSGKKPCTTAGIILRGNE